MTVGERIRAHRRQVGMSQEKLAELAGVSRQAVTKWENGQSAPSTEKLFRLAEIFDTTVDLLLQEDTPPAVLPQPDSAAVQQILELYRQQQEEKQAARRQTLRDNVRAAAQVLGSYLLVYLLGRILWCDVSRSTVLGWLFLARPQKPGSYLFGWLLHNRLFWWCAALAAGAALRGRYTAAWVQLAYFSAGLAAGVLFGPVPYGTGEYGWAYWAAMVLVSFPMGRLWQHTSRQSLNAQRMDRRLLVLTAASIVGALALVYLLIPKTVYSVV